MGKTLLSGDNENLIINPMWDLFQRGSSISGITSVSTYHADRYVQLFSSASGHDLAYQDLSSHADGTPLPANSLATTHGRIRNNVAVASPAANDYSAIAQRIEGYYANALRPKKRAFYSSLVYTNVPGFYSVFVFGESLGGSPSYVTERFITANTWTRIKLFVDEIPFSTGSWSSTNGIGMHVGITLFAGTNLKKASIDMDSWSSDGRLASPNQVNFGSAVDNRFYTTEWQLHSGVDEIPIEKLNRHPSTEEILARRYCRQIVDPTFGGGAAWLGTGVIIPTGTFAQVLLSSNGPDMRVVPTLTFSSLAHFVIQGQAVSFTLNPTSMATYFAINKQQYTVNVGVPVGQAGQIVSLRAQNTSAKLTLDSEI